jgi:hypothetical protein
MSITTKILISTSHGEQLVDAYRHGKFAVNRVVPDSNYPPEDALWSITHCATGLEVTRIWTRAAARKYARMLDAETTHDITAADHEAKTDDWKRFRKAMKALVSRQDEQ